MLRLRLTSVKPIALALLALGFVVGAMEVALRVHHSWSIQSQGDLLDFQRLKTPSWTCHHALKPLKSTLWRNPDTNLPVSIRTNNLGLRGGLISIPKPKGVFRILYLGDDAVFAGDVSEVDTFCHLIETDLTEQQGRRFEVINAGVPGYCPLLSYLQFQHALASLEPDLLILHFDASDVADDHGFRRHARLGPDGRPLLCPHPSLQLSAHPRSSSTGSNLLLVQALKRQLGFLPADESRADDQNEIDTIQGRYAFTRAARPDWQIYISQALSSIEDLRNLAESLSCPFVVTLAPLPWQVSERAMPDANAREAYGIPSGQSYEAHLGMGPVIEFFESRSIAYFDATGTFLDADEPERLFHETVPRFSRQGHLVFARGVAGYLTGRLENSTREIPMTGSP
jgi:hypothetical protein